MRLKLLSPQENSPCYTAEVHAVGVFRVQEGWPEERIVELVEANGAALLYGAIRELLCNLTSRGPWPMLSITAVTFIRPKMEKPKALPRKGEKGETSAAEKRA
jgi:preprotein translocase subunit SecB